MSILKISSVKIVSILICTTLFVACGSSDSAPSDTKQIEDENITQTKIVVDNITHNGTEYDTVTSPLTQRVWLDRNLGASQVCTSLDDEKCFGDYYQWGRNADGHEKLTSTTSVLADNVYEVGHGDFITNPVNEQAANDWADSSFSDGSIRSFNWSRINATYVCPFGYRVPTISEINDEVVSVTNQVEAFENFLKLPSAGFASASDGIAHEVGNYGTIWSNSIDNEKSKHFGFYDKGVQRNATTFRGGGFSVRCIQD